VKDAIRIIAVFWEWCPIIDADHPCLMTCGDKGTGEVMDDDALPASTGLGILIADKGDFHGDACLGLFVCVR
jgi:hypothetical protein